jgi:hypothetical protein
MERLTDDEFSKLMDKAFRTKERYPSVQLNDIAVLACADYHDRKDYGILIMQVTMNLVNAVRFQ